MANYFLKMIHGWPVFTKLKINLFFNKQAKSIVYNIINRRTLNPSVHASKGIFHITTNIAYQKMQL